eukprot:TRINITY_DN57379_c0_g1_i1.p1 TRINITY_DN57379_c0_g1~~TRINITY_DN57379_c0_g1_i1.p1  ORF type:complete len:296 (+),score=33.09 TRINITY_DN57379_c0_g1_i1:32-919(+)
MAEEEESVCAVCFDAVSYDTVLPCSCKVSYCSRCWDKSLAASFNSCGQARCPTCRGPVRIDFDATTGRLVFSREEDVAVESDQGKLERRQAATSRLLSQAQPAQIRLLKQMGKEQPQPQLQEAAKDPEASMRSLSASELKTHITMCGGTVDGLEHQSELLQNLLQTLGTHPTLLACHLAGGKMTCRPPCVCGCSLQRIMGHQRMVSASKTLIPDAPPQIQDTILEAMLSGAIAGVQCDLCNRPVKPSNGVWTCTNGTSTILHATAYDVCDICLAVEAYGLVPPPQPTPEAANSGT